LYCSLFLLMPVSYSQKKKRIRAACSTTRRLTECMWVT
jgi:hypothetical protein